jgi:hypothetical protein
MSQIVIDKNTIQSYSNALADKLSNDFFQTKSEITGNEIVHITNIEQLNMFVLMNLFDRWKEDVLRFKSPYFNYESDEVAQAFKIFVNKASNNILIKKEFFRPILQKSIQDTLTYLIQPVDFIKQYFNTPSYIKTSDIKEKEKFFKLYTSDIKAWISKLELKNEWTCNELVSAYELVAGPSKALTFNDPTVEKLNQLLKLTFQVSSQQQATIEKIVKTEPEPIIQPITTTLVVEEKIIEKKPETNQEIFTLKDKLNTLTNPSTATLNDVLKEKHSSTQPSIVERFTKSKIEDLKSSIPLNQKFLFINTLFDGKAHDYNEALNLVENCPTLEEVKNTLQNKYATKNKWEMRKGEVEEFFEILERKFY